jgi:hypothetical protein
MALPKEEYDIQDIIVQDQSQLNHHQRWYQQKRIAEALQRAAWATLVEQEREFYAKST